MNFDELSLVLNKLQDAYITSDVEERISDLEANIDIQIAKYNVLRDAVLEMKTPAEREHYINKVVEIYEGL